MITSELRTQVDTRTSDPHQAPDVPIPQDASEQKFLNDLLLVGPDKALGYLPLEAISASCKTDYYDLINYLTNKGISVHIYTEEECFVNSGAFYAFHEEALQNILETHQNILHAAGWPTETTAFVNTVCSVIAERGTQLYEVIAQCFGKLPGKE